MSERQCSSSSSSSNGSISISDGGTASSAGLKTQHGSHCRFVFYFLFFIYYTNVFLGSRYLSKRRCSSGYSNRGSRREWLVIYLFLLHWCSFKVNLSTNEGLGYTKIQDAMCLGSRVRFFCYFKILTVIHPRFKGPNDSSLSFRPRVLFFSY